MVAIQGDQISLYERIYLVSFMVLNTLKIWKHDYCSSQFTFVNPVRPGPKNCNTSYTKSYQKNFYVKQVLLFSCTQNTYTVFARLLT